MVKTETKKFAGKTALKQRGRPFKKGQSGNPAGRPKGSKNFSTLFYEAVKVIAEEKHIEVADAERDLVMKAYFEARKGNFSFYRDIMDRIYGKAPETINIKELPMPILGKTLDKKKKV